MRALRGTVVLALALAATGCAGGDRWVYKVPPGGSAEQLKRDQETCSEEAGISRLSEDRVILEHSCMNDRGYVAEPAS